MTQSVETRNIATQTQHVAAQTQNIASLRGRPALAWLLDFEQFARSLIRIQDKEGQVVPLRLNEAQRDYRRIAGQRNVVLKARQEGISTVIEAEMLHEAETGRNRRGVIITHESGATFVQKERLHFMWAHQAVRPGLDRNNRRELSFPSTGSSIYTGTAGSREFGRSDTIHRAHCSEFAFWPHPQILAGLMEAVPAGGRIDIESTPDGHNHFYRFWKEARAGANAFKTIFLPWFIHAAYRRKPGVPMDEWTEEEKVLGLKALAWGVMISPEQIAWRRWKIADLAAIDMEGVGKFAQEYPEDDETCFLFSGRPRFDNGKLNALLAAVGKPLREEHLPDSLLTLRTWAEPKEGEFYVVSADSAEGLSAGDYDSASVLHWRTGAKVAGLYGKAEVFQYAYQLVRLANRYNRAMLAVEMNHPGPAVIAKCMELGYPNLFYHTDEQGNRAERPGWSTDKYWRPQMIDELALYLKAAPAGAFPDGGEIGEMMSFVVGPRGKAEAAKGAHDDMVMDRAIGLMVRKLWHPRESVARSKRQDTVGRQK